LRLFAAAHGMPVVKALEDADADLSRLETAWITTAAEPLCHLADDRFIYQDPPVQFLGLQGGASFAATPSSSQPRA